MRKNKITFFAKMQKKHQKTHKSCIEKYNKTGSKRLQTKRLHFVWKIAQNQKKSRVAYSNVRADVLPQVAKLETKHTKQTHFI